MHTNDAQRPARRGRIRGLILVVAIVAALLAIVPLQATPAAATSDGEAASFLAELNQFRAEVGSPPMSLCPTLMSATQRHADDMAFRHVLDPVGGDGSTPDSRAVTAGYTEYFDLSTLWTRGPIDAEEAWLLWLLDDDVSLIDPQLRHFALGAQWGSDGLRYWSINAGGGGSCTVDPFGGFDLLQGGYETVRVAGWAIDPNTSAPIQVHLYAGSTPLGAVTAGIYRPDLGNIEPYRGANHAFDATLSAPPGTYDVCAIAINVMAGGNHQLGCRQVTVKGASPFGGLDVASAPTKGKLRVAGWAIDPEAGTGPVEIHRYVDGVGANLGLASLQRNDVAAAYPAFGGAHGFDVTTDATPGNHQVCVYAINVGKGGTTQLGCRTVWVPDPLSPFLDVLSTSPFFADIVWLTEEGIASGYADGSFKPGAPVSRQAMASFLWRMAGSPAPDPGAPSFTDVPIGHPFHDAIAWLAGEGIASGFADGTFKPTAPVSRQAMASFLWNLEGSPTPTGDSPFSDVPPSHPFHDAITWLAESGIASGFANGTFKPGAAVSRQAMAAFLHRLAALPAA